MIKCSLCGETLLCHSYAHWLRKHKGISKEQYLTANNISERHLENFVLVGREGQSDLLSVIILKRKRKKWLSDIKRIKDMKIRRVSYFQAGYTDQEVAEFEGMTRKGIASYRRSLGIEPNIKKN